MYIHMKQGTTQISEDGSGSTPFSVGPVDAATSTPCGAEAMLLYCDAGYKAAAGAVLSFVGANKDRWQLSMDGTAWPATWGGDLTITAAIPTAGLTVYARAKALSTEAPSVDTSVDMKIVATILPA